MLLFAITRQDRKKAFTYTVLVFCCLIYTLGYLIEVNSSTAESALNALRVQALAIPLIAPLFMLSIAGFFYPNKLQFKLTIAAIIYNFILYPVSFTSNIHNLYYVDLHMVTTGGFTHISAGHGIAYYIQQAISMLCLVTTYVLLFHRYARGTSQLRKQMKMLVFGSFLCGIINVLYILGLVPGNLDCMPITSTSIIFLLSISLHKNRLLDIVPVASSAAVETMDDALFVLDRDLRFQYCNRSAERLFPELSRYTGGELLTKMGGWPNELMRLDIQGQINFQLDCGGSPIDFRANISKVELNGANVGWSVVIRDMADTMELVRKLEDLATTDPLTGICNRRHFMQMSQRAVDLANRNGLVVLVILCDIDNFKDVNDTYGHSAGDTALCHVVNLLKTQLRSYDIFARLGGDEFVILTTSKDSSLKEAFAHRLCSVLQENKLKLEKTSIPITCSFGMTQILPGEPLTAALEKADAALYEAKARGRNRIVVR